MQTPSACPGCGADWSGGQPCEDHFHALLFWEFDRQLFDAHHLMVLCYHLQHPHRYSPEALAGAAWMLAAFVEGGTTPAEMRQQISRAADSGRRAGRITGTAEVHGSYPNPVAWRMTTADVVRTGVDQYYASVNQWAAAILADLRESGNLLAVQLAQVTDEHLHAEIDFGPPAGKEAW